MPEKKDEKKSEDTTVKKKKPPVVIIIAVIAVLALAGGLVVGKQVSAKSKHGAHQKVTPGPIMPLDEFLVNLADPSGDHFLKITVNLELTQASGDTADSLKPQIPVIRDAVLTALCSKTRSQISTLDGRVALKNEILQDVNTSLGKNVVEKVYFSDFVSQ